MSWGVGYDLSSKDQEGLQQRSNCWQSCNTRLQDGCEKGPTEGPPPPRVRDLLGEVGDAVLRVPVHPTVLVPPAEVTVPSTVVPGGWQRQQGL